MEKYHTFRVEAPQASDSKRGKDSFTFVYLHLNLFEVKSEYSKVVWPTHTSTVSSPSPMKSFFSLNC